jgi:hypothetical protein
VGNDTINIGLSNVTIGSAAAVWMNLWGGDNNDAITVNYQGQMNGRLLLHAEGNNGDDSLSVNFNLSSGSMGRVGDGGSPSNDFQTEWNRMDRVVGGLGHDTMSFTVTAPPQQVHAAVVTEGPGADTFGTLQNVQPLVDPSGGWAPGQGH